MSDPRKKPYSTAEVMKTFDLGRNALRLYEEMGLLSGMSRTDSGYREFSTRHLEDLKFILESKKVGFTLNEIKEFLEVIRVQKRMTCGTVSAEINHKIEEIEDQLKTLNAKKVFLSDFLKTCSSNGTDSECDVMAAGFSKKACCS